MALIRQKRKLSSALLMLAETSGSVLGRCGRLALPTISTPQCGHGRSTAAALDNGEQRTNVCAGVQRHAPLHPLHRHRLFRRCDARLQLQVNSGVRCRRHWHASTDSASIESTVVLDAAGSRRMALRGTGDGHPDHSRHRPRFLLPHRIL